MFEMLKRAWFWINAGDLNELSQLMKVEGEESIRTLRQAVARNIAVLRQITHISWGD